MCVLQDMLNYEITALTKKTFFLLKIKYSGQCSFHSSQQKKKQFTYVIVIFLIIYKL